jgi:hypothetical protein
LCAIVDHGLEGHLKGVTWGGGAATGLRQGKKAVALTESGSPSARRGHAPRAAPAVLPCTYCRLVNTSAECAACTD